MILRSFGLLTICAAVFILAIPVGSQELSDVKHHGNCATGTLSDPMSDELGAFLFCGTEPTILLVALEPGQMGLQVAVLSSLTKTVAENSTLDEVRQISDSEVKFRVDKGGIFAGRGYLAKDGFLYMENDALAKEIMQKISGRQKLHFSIDGTATETIELQGSKEAVEDMKRRLQGE